MGTKLQFRKAQITQKTRRKLYCDYLNNLNHQKLNEWFSLRSAQKSLVYFRTKKREFLNNALIVETKSSDICGIRNTSFVHTFILSYQTHWGAQDCWIRYIFWKHVIHIIELIDAGYYFVWVEIQWSYFCLFQKNTFHEFCENWHRRNYFFYSWKKQNVFRGSVL